MANVAPGQCAVFVATKQDVLDRFQDWHRWLEAPREVKGRDPFTGQETRRLTREPDPGAPASYAPDCPPFPFVQLPLAYCYWAELTAFYGRVVGWAEDEFPGDWDEMEECWQRVVPTILSSGAELEISLFDTPFRDRLAAMTPESWQGILASLGLEEQPMLEARFKNLFSPLSALARGAKERGEELWLFGRA